MNKDNQQTDFRGFVELNEAVDNINMKLLDLEKKIDTVGVFYYTVMAYLAGKLTKEEVVRIKERFGKASKDEVDSFLDSLDIMNDGNKEIKSITDMLDELDDDRWNE